MRFKAIPCAATLIPMLALSACSTAEEPRYNAQEAVPPVYSTTDDGPKQAAPTRPAQPVDPDDWERWPREEGDWVYRRDGRGSIALFGVPYQDAKLTVRCDSAAKLIIFSRAGKAPDGAVMRLRASEGMISLDARSVDGELPYMAAGVAPRSQILDQLAYSRGHFAVEIEGIKPVKIPAWPEMTRVIEDCRG